MDLSENRIAIIDDDPDILLSAQLFLKKYFNEIYLFNHPQEFLDSKDLTSISLLLLDLNYTSGQNDGREGIAALEAIKKEFKAIEVVVMTAYAAVDLAVEAVKKGAFDFVVKPWQNEKLLITIINAIQKRSLRDQLFQKEVELATIHKASDAIVGESEVMQKLRKLIVQLAPTDASVHLIGEKGSGKELVARHLHQLSKRSNQAFVAMDCSLLSESEQLVELFGNNEQEHGKWDLAKGGTLFLKEIAAMKLQVQQELWNALTKPEGNNIRLISSTSQSLSEGELRKDLKEKITAVEIDIPALREHSEDLQDLVNYFLDRYCNEYGNELPILSVTLFEDLEHYSWPMNVRELKKAIRAATALGLEELKADNLIPLTPKGSSSSADFSLEQLEKDHIHFILRKNKGNIQQSALDLNISRAALYRRIDKYQIKL